MHRLVALGRQLLDVPNRLRPAKDAGKAAVGAHAAVRPGQPQKRSWPLTPTRAWTGFCSRPYRVPMSRSTSRQSPRRSPSSACGRQTCRRRPASTTLWHTGLSSLAESMTELQARAGHTTAAIAMRYQHARAPSASVPWLDGWGEVAQAVGPRRAVANDGS